MKVLKSKRNGNTISLEVEASYKELESKFDSAFKKVSKKAVLPGFRKGKVPRAIFEREFGKSHIIQEAINDVVNDSYRAAIDELNLKVIDYPKNVEVDDYKESAPVTFRCDVDVEPDVKLKKYKGLKVAVDQKNPTKDEYDKEINDRIAVYGTYDAVEREAQMDDIVRFNAKVTLDGQPFELWSRENLATRLGVYNYGEAFDAEVVGLIKGGKKTFSVTYADDFKTPQVAGKTVEFDVEITEVRERKMPELNDELVKKVDESCQTVNEWKEKVKKEVDSTFENNNKNAIESAVFDALIEENPIELPEAMIEQEITLSLMRFEYSIQQQGLNLSKYMSLTNQTENDLRNGVKDTTIKSVKLRKLFEAIIDKEKIQVTDNDIQKEITDWNHDTIKSIDDLSASKNHDVKLLKKDLLDKKVREFIIQSAKIK